MVEVSIATVTLKTDRPKEVARFWRDLLGYRVAPNRSDSVMLVGDYGPALLIQPSVLPPADSAIHLDLRPEDQRACVDRALELGASLVDIGQTGQEGWTMMADPGGNHFCVLQSRADFEGALAENPRTREALRPLIDLSGTWLQRVAQAVIGLGTLPGVHACDVLI
ncbi:VOC family protein [Sinomonas sp. ASV322]|uniref:VOC family protein n=1 Tax=Sinomonas sp. ASV322 TaxID=3041920 RepID=UPI0027DD3670|nr:VOC family protein [Sinomonas sp. ASV322]MDQ4504317.1 VOC family protein [Sinomonas sp. ASV322]